MNNKRDSNRLLPADIVVLHIMKFIKRWADKVQIGFTCKEFYTCFKATYILRVKDVCAAIVKTDYNSYLGCIKIRPFTNQQGTMFVTLVFTDENTMPSIRVDDLQYRVSRAMYPCVANTLRSISLQELGNCIGAVEIRKDTEINYFN